MSIDINILNAQLQSIAKNSNIDQVLNLQTDVVNQAACQAQTALTKVGEAVSGFVPLSQATDDVNALVADATNCIVEITGDVPGLADDLIGDVTSAASELNAITGGSSSNGSLNFVISSGSPEAIAKSLKSVTGKAASEIEDVLKSVAPEGAKDAVAKLDDVLTSGISGATGLTDAISSFGSNFNDLIGNATGGILTNLIRKIDKQTDAVLNNLLGGFDIDINIVVDLIAKGNSEEAIQLVVDTTNLPEAEVEEVINNIDLNPASNITANTSPEIGTRTNECFVIGSNNNTWRGENTAINSDQFTYIDSQEELIAEFRNCTRDITEFVAHWAGTYINQDIGAEEIHQWHLDRGWSGCGYHYVIRRDGTLQRGRPLQRTGAHSGAYGHNRYSIGITFAAGYNCPSGTPNPNRYISGDSINAAQMNTFRMWTQAFYDVWPGGQAFGHYHTTDAGKVDPGFDVWEYVKAHFGKENILTDATKGPLTPAQIAQGNT